MQKNHHLVPIEDGPVHEQSHGLMQNIQAQLVGPCLNLHGNMLIPVLTHIQGISIREIAISLYLKKINALISFNSFYEHNIEEKLSSAYLKCKVMMYLMERTCYVFFLFHAIVLSIL